MAYRYDPKEGLVVTSGKAPTIKKKTVASKLPVAGGGGGGGWGKQYDGTGLEGMDNAGMVLSQGLAAQGGVNLHGPNTGFEGMDNLQMVVNQGQLERGKTNTPNEPPVSQYGGQVRTNYSSAATPATNYASQTPETVDPRLRSGQELADLFGMIFGREEIEAILNQATKAKFDEWTGQTEKLRDQSLTDYSSQYNQYLQHSRGNRQNAVKHGIKRGSDVAQEVLEQMGAQQYGAENQSQYQQQMGDIAFQRGSQLAYDKYNAMTTQNELAGQLGNLSMGAHSNEVQQQAAQLSHHGQMVQADATTKAAQISADAQVNSAGVAANAQRYYADVTAAASAQGGPQAGMDVGYNLLIEMDYPKDIAYGIAYGSISLAQGQEMMKQRKKDQEKGNSGGFVAGLAQNAARMVTPIQNKNWMRKD